MQPDAELPALSTAALIEPEESAVGVSPITTSALEPSRDAAAIASDVLPATSAGRLPGKIEQLADAGPENVKLAAASDVDDRRAADAADHRGGDAAGGATSPPIESEREPVAKTRRAKKRTALRAYRTSNDLAGSRGKKSGEAAPKSPKWAQQMFVTPWQTRAFSYTQ